MAYYETYQWAWLVYLIAALGMYFVVVKFTKYWTGEYVRNYLRLFSAVILFTPAIHTADENTILAPAFIVAFGEFLTADMKAAMAGVLPLLLALFLGLVILAIRAFLKRKAVKS